MAETVDTSSYGQGYNPMNALQQGMGAMATALPIVGQQAIGNALQHATNPDGTVDNNKLQAFMSQTPAGQMYTGQAMEMGNQITAQQLHNQLGKLDVAKQKIGWTTSAFAPLLNQPNLSKKDILNATSDIVAMSSDDNGKPAVSAYDALGLNEDPKIGTPLSVMPDDPQALNGWLKQRLSMAQALNGHLDNAYQTIYARNPALAATQQVWNPQANGGRGAYVGNVNSSPASTQQREGNVNSNPAQSAPPSGPTPEAPPASAQSLPLPGAAPTNGPMLLAAPPGVEQNLNNLGDATSKRVTATIAAAQTAPVSQDINRQIIRIAGELGNGVGPVQSDVTSVMGKIADTPVLGPILKSIQGDKPATDAAGQLMELKKFLLRSAQTRSQAVGAGTDYQTNLNVDANPNDKQFPQVIQQLAKYNMALDYVDQGKANAMQATQGAISDPAANEKFENSWRNGLDVNVYRGLLASPHERAQLYQGMSPSEKRQMAASYAKLKHMNAIPDSLRQQASSSSEAGQ